MTTQTFKMNVDQFKQSLIDMGYKELDHSDNEHTRYKKHNKMVTIQSLCGENVYFDIERKGYQVQHIQFDVKDFKKALANIKKFERKMGR